LVWLRLKRAELKQVPLVLQTRKGGHAELEPRFLGSATILISMPLYIPRSFQDQEQNPITSNATRLSEDESLLLHCSGFLIEMHWNDGDSIDKINQIYLFFCCLHRP